MWSRISIAGPSLANLLSSIFFFASSASFYSFSTSAGLRFLPLPFLLLAASSADLFSFSRYASI